MECVNFSFKVALIFFHVVHVVSSNFDIQN